jgi:pimeloyl-ACP methyl ester carboxylesterase
MTTTETSPPAGGLHATTLDLHGWPTTVRRSGAGRTVVFLHGAFFPTDWLPFHERLSARCDLVAPVVPGYLEGGPPDLLRGFDDLVVHTRAVLDALGVGRFDLVGYDIGAWLAGNVATFHPDRVRSLTVIAPMGVRVAEAPPMEWMAASPGRVTDALFNGDPGEHAGLFPPPSDIDGFVRTYGENGVTARLIWERRYDVRLDRRLAHLDVPTHVVTAADDRIVPAAHAQRWAELVPAARLTTLDGVGHAMLVQQPDTVVDAIVPFIQEVPE